VLGSGGNIIEIEHYLFWSFVLFMEDHVCSIWCELGVVGKCREYQFVLGAGLVRGPCGRLGEKGKLILK
jgi:hypothetical protein